MDHEFECGYCMKCGRSRVELVAYGAPYVEIQPGPSGLSCTGQTNAAEIESLRAAWRKDQDMWAKILA